MHVPWPQNMHIPWPQYIPQGTREFGGPQAHQWFGGKSMEALMSPMNLSGAAIFYICCTFLYIVAHTCTFSLHTSFISFIFFSLLLQFLHVLYICVTLVFTFSACFYIVFELFLHIYTFSLHFGASIGHIIRASFGHHSGIMWASFGYHLGIIWASFGHHSGIIWA